MCDNDHRADPASSGDDELVARLRRLACELDPVPDDVLAAARAAITTRDLDGQLAALVADSATGDLTGADLTSAATVFESVRTGAGGIGAARLLCFAGNGVQVDVELTERDGRVDLTGMVSGAGARHCALEYASGERRDLDVDDLARFTLTDVPRGLVRVRCRSAAGALVTTSWFRI